MCTFCAFLWRRIGWYSTQYNKKSVNVNSQKRMPSHTTPPPQLFSCLNWKWPQIFIFWQVPTSQYNLIKWWHEDYVNFVLLSLVPRFYIMLKYDLWVAAFMLLLGIFCISQMSIEPFRPSFIVSNKMHSFFCCWIEHYHHTNHESTVVA